MHSEFTIKDLGLLHYFLGLEVHYVSNGIVLTQRKFTQEFHQESGFLDATPIVTLLPQNVKFANDTSHLLSNPTEYRTLIGKFNFLTHTRPDISFVVQTLSQFMQQSRQGHMMGVHHLLRYLKGSSGQGILLNNSSQISLNAYFDSD